MPKRSNSKIKEYQLRSGAKRYMFKAYLGLDSNGRPVKVTRRGFISYTQANEEYNKLRALGAPSYVKPKQIKLDDLWNIWFKAYLTQVKETNANKVSAYYTNHIQPYFGQNYMDKIKIKDLQVWIEKLSTKLVNYRRMYQLLSRLYRYALSLGYVKFNPCQRLIIPRKSKNRSVKSKNNFYNRNELEEFLKDAKEFNFKFYTFFYLLASTGLRRGEGLGLMWKDIDYDKKVIHVRRTTGLGLENKVVIVPPKTHMSYRDVPMTDKLALILRKYHMQQYPLNDKLFSKRDGGWKNPADAGDWLKQIYREYPNLRKITVHGFRHTFATLLIEETDIKPKAVQHILGHESVNMTLNIYTHVTKNDKRKALRQIASLDI